MNGRPLTAVVGLLLLASVAMAAGAAPQGADLTRIDLALVSTARIRLATARGTAIVSETRATEAGITFRHLLASQRTDTLRSPGLIGWDEIQSVDAQGSTDSPWLTPGRLAIVGLVFGAGLGTYGAFTDGWVNAGGLSVFLFPPAGAGLGYGIGRLIEPSRREWRPIYP